MSNYQRYPFPTENYLRDAVTLQLFAKFNPKMCNFKPPSKWKPNPTRQLEKYCHKLLEKYHPGW